MVDLPVLVVTCAPRRARAQRLADDLQARGYARVRLIDGVYWRDLTEAPPWSVRHPGRDGAADYKPMQYWADPYSRRAMTLGEVACTLSHVRAWREAAQHELVLVLEDDVSIKPSFENISGVLDDLGSLADWGVCFVSHRNQRLGDGEHVGKYARRLLQHPLWTCGYLLSRAGAAKLLASPFMDSLIPADDFIPATFGVHSDPWLNLQGGAGKGGLLGVYDTPQRMVDQAGTFGESMTEKSLPVREPSRIHVFAAATDPGNAGCIRYLETANRHGFWPRLVGEREAGWNTDREGGGMKLKWYRDVLHKSRLADDAIVMFTDVYDVVFAGAEGDVLSRFGKTNLDVLFSAEKFCWPDVEVADQYPQSPTPWRFLNSGAFMGRAAAVREMLERVHESVGGDYGGKDDQRLLTAEYLRHVAKTGTNKRYDLDRSCQIFMSVNGSQNELQVDTGRGGLVNRLTGTRPIVVHANGASTDWLDGHGACVGGRRRDNYGTISIGGHVRHA